MTGDAEEPHGIDGVATLPCGDSLIITDLGHKAIGLDPSLVIGARRHLAIVIPCLIGAIPILDIIELAAGKTVIVMMLHETVDNILAVFGFDLGLAGLLVNDGITFLVQDMDGIELEGYQTVVIGVNQGVAHRFDIHFLSHTAVVHVLVILFNLDAVGKCPRLGAVSGLVVGECRFQLVECFVIAIHGHRQSAEHFLGLVNKQMLASHTK